MVRDSKAYRFRHFNSVIRSNYHSRMLRFLQSWFRGLYRKSGEQTSKFNKPLYSRTSKWYSWWSKRLLSSCCYNIWTR